jgi:transcription elongation GreA/GreB family factor
MLDPREDERRGAGQVALEQFDKQELLADLVAQLLEQVEGMTRRAKEIAASATHEESRPESDKDTRAIEESYLARGQSLRAAQAEKDLQVLRSLRVQSFDEDQPIAVTALVMIEDQEGNSKVVFLAPAAGGTRLQTQGNTVNVVTVGSPLGRGLLGKQVDDDFEISAGGPSRDWTIVEVV